MTDDEAVPLVGLESGWYEPARDITDDEQAAAIDFQWDTAELDVTDPIQEIGAIEEMFGVGD